MNICFRKNRGKTIDNYKIKPVSKRTGGHQQNTIQLDIEVDIDFTFFSKYTLLFTFEGHHYENIGISIYNTRGSQALLEEIDPDEKSDDADIDEFEGHNYVNVTMTRICLQRMWEYKLQNTANDCINTEFKVY